MIRDHRTDADQSRQERHQYHLDHPTPDGGLLPCPFCGGSPRTSAFSGRAECGFTATRGKHSLVSLPPDVWNRRAQPHDAGSPTDKPEAATSRGAAERAEIEKDVCSDDDKLSRAAAAILVLDDGFPNWIDDPCLATIRAHINTLRQDLRAPPSDTGNTDGAERAPRLLSGSDSTPPERCERSQGDG